MTKAAASAASTKAAASAASTKAAASAASTKAAASAASTKAAASAASTKAAATAAGTALLTEQQLLKMKADDYMNAQQLAFFRNLLVRMKEEYLSNAGQTSEHLRENDMVPDPADRATIEEEHALELRVRDRERKQMKKIDEALARIEDGGYGWCEETGEPIGIARLLARPTATMSVEAQARRELKQKMYG